MTSHDSEPTSRRKIWAAVFVLLVLGTGVLVWKFSDPSRRFERWLEEKIAQGYQDVAGPNPRLVLSEVKVSASLGEVARGRVESVGLTFELKNGKRTDLWIRIKGPLTLNQDLIARDFKMDLEVRYSPKIQIQTPPGSPWGFPEFELGITAVADPRAGRLKSLQLRPQIGSWNQNSIHLAVNDPALSVDFDGSLSKVEFSAANLTWQPSDERAVSLSGLKGTVSLPLGLNPFVVGPEVVVEGALENAEVLWDDAYGEIPLRRFPARLTALLDAHPGHRDLPVTSAVLKLGDPARPLVEIEAAPVRAPKTGPVSRVDARLEIPALPLKDLWEGVLALFAPGVSEGLDRLRDLIEIRGGVLNVTASIKAPIAGDGNKVLDLDGTIKLRNASVATRDRVTEASGIDMTIPISFGAPTSGEIRARSLRFRKLTGSLDPWKFTLTPRLREDPTLLFEFASREGPRIRFDEIPWKMGPISARISRPGQEGATPAFWAATDDLVIGPVSAKALTEPLCLPARRTPDAHLEANFRKITLNPAALQAFGTLEAKLFEGYARITDPKIFSPLSAVPETQFSAEWNGIRLDDIGRWTGFGQMRGVLKGHARDVVIQGWLPTQYDFKSELKPYKGDDVLFSTKAVENVVLVLSGEDFRSKLPGIARFFIYDIPEFIMPGFKIKWAGIRLYSRDGWVLVEDLTPKAFLKSGSIGSAEPQRYFIYGPRITIPFNASQYPVVLDASAMANYTRKMAAYFETILENKRREERAKLEQSQQGVPNDDVPKLCVPDPVARSF